MSTKHNDGKHIVEVVNRTQCKKHERPVGVACWDVHPDTNRDEVARAVCGSRIRSAGFVGKISETSIQSKRRAAAENKKEVAA